MDKSVDAQIRNELSEISKNIDTILERVKTYYPTEEDAQTPEAEVQGDNGSENLNQKN